MKKLVHAVSNGYIHEGKGIPTLGIQGGQWCNLGGRPEPIPLGQVIFKEYMKEGQ